MRCYHVQVIFTSKSASLPTIPAVLTKSDCNGIRADFYGRDSRPHYSGLSHTTCNHDTGVARQQVFQTYLALPSALIPL